jgi:hypothetical protein
MHFAYIILAHKEPKQVAQLVKALYHPDDYYFIHIDAKIDLHPFQEVINELCNDPKNILFVENRENGQWGDLGIVKGTLNAIRKIIATNIEFCHIHLLSGQDFPIKHVDIIRGFFSQHPNEDFISYEAFPVQHIPGGGWHRLEHYSWTIGNKRLTYVPAENAPSFNTKGKIVNGLLWMIERFLPKRRLPYNMQPYYGSQWWSITGETAKQILSWCERHPKYMEFHRHSLLPDEMFFQTLILHQDGNKTTVNDNKRFILWKKGSSHPTNLCESHHERLLLSKACFARKFTSSEVQKWINKMNNNET